MAKNRSFTMNGKNYNTMKEIADELGKSRIRPADFEKYGIKEVVDEDNDKVDAVANDTDKYFRPAASDAAEEVPAEVKVDDAADDKADAEEVVADEPEKVDEPKAEEVPADDKAEEVPAKKVKKEKEVVTLDSLVTGTIEEFSKKMRKVSMDDIIAFAEKNDINKYDDVDNASIRRMKIVADIRTKFFGDQKVAAKKSGFEKVATDVIIKLADDNAVEYKKSDNPAIQRMWVIFALKQAGVAAPAPAVDEPKGSNESNDVVADDSKEVADEN